MIKKLVILGASGNCLDILEAVRNGNRTNPKYEILGFLDDALDKQGQHILDVPVMGALSDGGQLNDCYFVNGIGNERSFSSKAETIDRTGIPIEKFVTVIHPAASVAPSATIGRGTVILANTTIGANAVLGTHVMILPGCVVSHDCHLGDYSIVTSGATLCGAVTLAPSCYIGAGSVLLSGIKVASNSLVGAGSVVTRDVPPSTVVCGNPAQKL